MCGMEVVYMLYEYWIHGCTSEALPGNLAYRSEGYKHAALTTSRYKHNSFALVRVRWLHPAGPAVLADACAACCSLFTL